jgi:hypothetical protein
MQSAADIAAIVVVAVIVRACTASEDPQLLSHLYTQQLCSAHMRAAVCSLAMHTLDTVRAASQHTQHNFSIDACS